MVLSNRLKAMADLIRGEYLADIGTDHGYLPIYLAKRPGVKKLVASDISNLSLAKLKKNLGEEDSKIDLVVSDGLTHLVSPFPDLVSISGMGGPLIIEILKKDMEKTRAIGKFVLQANTQVRDLRRFLLKEGFNIEDELAVSDEGIYYTIILASMGDSKSYQEWDLEYGLRLLEKKDPLTFEKIRADETRLEKILIKLEKNDLDKVRQDQIQNQLSNIREALKYYED